MSSIINADLPQLETLSRRLNACGGDVNDLKANMTGLLGATDWQGGAAQRVRDAWETQFRPALDEMTQALNDMSAEVNQRKMRIDAAAN